MECINHNSPAKGMCLSCGKFLCINCIQPSKNGKIVCSTECASHQERQELAMNHLAEKSQGMSFASAFGGYLLGLIFLASAFFMRVPEVRMFLLAAGFGMLCMGAFYHINAAKKLKSKAS
jgi:hypothetical protein